MSVVRLILGPVEQLTTGSGVYTPGIGRRGRLNLGLMFQLRLRTLPSSRGRGYIPHLRVLPHIHPGDIRAELDGNPVGIPGVYGADEAVVDHPRDLIISRR